MQRILMLEVLSKECTMFQTQRTFVNFLVENVKYLEICLLNANVQYQTYWTLEKFIDKSNNCMS